MKAILLTGKTYENRRALRALGAVWQPALTGYALPLDKREAAEALAGLNIEPHDFDADPFRPLSPDELRAYRQNRQDRRADRLRERAALADARARKAGARVSPGEREFLSLAEPVKVGHHSERRHRKLIEKAWDSAMEAGREYNYAQKLRQRADWMQPARVKGDAAAARKDANNAARDLFDVGDTVSDLIMGQGVIVKKNPKSFSVRFSSGYTGTTSPRHLKLISKGEGVAPERVLKFKKGDQVLYYPHGKNNAGGGKAWPATVLRVTPRGYSIEHRYGYADRAMASKTTVREESLELATGATP